MSFILCAFIFAPTKMIRKGKLYFIKPGIELNSILAFMSGKH